MKPDVPGPRLSGASSLRRSAETSSAATGSVPGALALLLLSLLAGVSASAQTSGSITIDPQRKAGTDTNGRVQLFAPNPLEGGSSISHFDRSASPNLLMEPSINSDLRHEDVDLTTPLFQDEGWVTSGGSEIRLSFPDGASEGFNHPSLGNSRRTAARRAADVWQSILSSPVPINVAMQFVSLSCDPDNGAVLAQAGANFLFKTDGTPFPDSWYHGALAEALTGSNLSTEDNPDPNAADITVTFNSAIDNNCLENGASYYYGLDGNVPNGQISFIAVALHEIAHGLGFGNFVNEDTGEKFQGDPDIYARFTRDNVLKKSWAKMTAAQIRASAVRTGEVVWSGGNVKQRAQDFLDPSTVLVVDEPSDAAGSYLVSTATFGPSVQTTPVSGELVIVTDGSAEPTLGCQPLQNTSMISGSVAVVDRGSCLFVDKVQNAQNAGALGVVVVNNEPGRIMMGGDDPGLSIPAVMVSQSDGEAIKEAIRNPIPDPPDDPPDDPIQDLPPEDPSVCEVSETRLCLNGGRFRIEVEWMDKEGNQGSGNATDLGDDSGYFVFFDPSNVELLVKVLDGCGFNDRYWVFSGGLTNVEVDLFVVDTWTGLGKLYKNRLGEPYAPVQDAMAFATCP